jgi:hypothetical protein
MEETFGLPVGVEFLLNLLKGIGLRKLCVKVWHAEVLVQWWVTGV